jgi:hypothetical protein
MWLLIVYIVIVVVGDLIAYAIGSVVESMFSPAVGLPVFLALFFAVFGLGWMLAVRLTAKLGMES